MKTRSLELVDRDAWIVDRVEGKRVLHIGCTDWPLTADRVKSGRLLHSRLCEAAARCVGVDLDYEGIQELRSLMNGHEFHVLNAETLGAAAELAGTRWDYIVAGDVVEHMNNPGLFFQSTSELLADGGKLMVTVPNAFSAKRFFWMLFTGNEQVHPDHTAYFSEATLSRIAHRNDYALQEIHGFQWANPTLKNRIVNILATPLLWLSRGRCADELAVILARK